MVNEEAIKILANFKRYISGGGVVDREANAAIDMAISALKLSDSIIKQLDCKMFHSGVNVDNIVSDETTDIIYRQAAIDAIKNNVYAITPTQIDTKIDCIESVEAVPSAQSEIIYCEDCKHHRQNDYGDSWCAHPKGLDQFDLMPTDFCSMAERR